MNYKKTEIGLIPEHWEVRTLEQTCEMIMGQSPPSSTYSDKPEGLPFYQGKADFGFMNPIKRIYCTTPVKIAIKNDIIISVRAPVGDVNVLAEKSCIGRGLAALRARSGNEYMFIYYYMLFKKEYVASLGSGSTFKSINKSQLASIPIISISNVEQRKILFILSRIQISLMNQTHIIENLRELKKALMQKLFTKGLNSEQLKDTKIGMVPESWFVLKIGEVCKVTSGGTPRRDNNLFWDYGTIPWVKTGEINYCLIKDTEEQITELALSHSSTRMYKLGTLLMAMYGQGITRGRVAILGIDAAINQACAAIVPLEEGKFDIAFLYYLFEYSYERIRDFGHGANQSNLSATIIKSMEFAFPEIKEQMKISKILKAVDNKLSLAKRKKVNTSLIFDGLLRVLMRGEKIVTDLEI